MHSGGWSINGVTTTLINSSYVQCVTSHLACYAVLFGDAAGISSNDTIVRISFLI